MSPQVLTARALICRRAGLPHPAGDDYHLICSKAVALKPQHWITAGSNVRARRATLSTEIYAAGASFAPWASSMPSLLSSAHYRYGWGIGLFPLCVLAAALAGRS